MKAVIEDGGLPVYVLATLGTTDTFGIDDLEGIRNLTEELESEYGLPHIYIHADTAMGGMYSFLTYMMLKIIRSALKMKCLRCWPATNPIFSISALRTALFLIFINSAKLRMRPAFFGEGPHGFTGG